MPSKFAHEQRLLLEVIFSPKTRAISRWEEWSRSYAIDAVPFSTYRLLPAVFVSLERYGIEYESKTTLTEIYKNTFVNNETSLWRLSKLIELLAKHSVVPVVLKGAATMLQFFPDRGVRVIADLDIFVPKSAVSSLIPVLNQAGWNGPIHKPPLKLLLEFSHAVNFRNQERKLLDLHYHLFHYPHRREIEHLLLEDTHEVSCFGHTARALSPSGHVAHLLGSASTQGFEESHWMMDLIAIGQHCSWELDWELIFNALRSCRAEEFAAEAFQYLEEELGIGLPTVQAMPAVGMITSYRRRVLQRLQKSSGITGGIARVAVAYLRLTADKPLYFRLTGFFDYLRYRWRIPTKTALKRVVINKVKKLRGA